MTWKIRTAIAFALMLILVASQPIAAVQSTATQPASEIQKIDAYLEAKRQQYRIPGLAIAIVQGNRIIHAKGSGMPYEQYVQQHIIMPLEMTHSYTSQQQAQKATPALSVGNRFWFGYPVWTEVPYNRGDLPSGYLISSAGDMGRYLIAQLNEGRYKNVTLVPNGIAELHQPAVDVGGGQSYGMGWFRRNLDGIAIAYHTGATANYSANMTLIPDRKLGFALLTNVYSGIGKEAIPQLYKGVVNLLAGRPPAAPRNNPVSAIQAIALPALLLLQLWRLFRTLRVLRRWHHPERPYFSVKSRLWHIGLPLIVDGAIAVGLLVGLPILFNAPLPIMLYFQPDALGIAILCVALAIVGGFLRAAIALRLLSKTSA